MFDEDELARRMKSIDPASTPLSETLSDRASNDLQKLLDDRSPKTVARRTSRAWIGIPGIAVALILMLFVFQNLLGGAPSAQIARAATPPLLVGVGEKLSLGESVKNAIDQLQADRAPSSRSSKSEAWFLDTELDADGNGKSFVAPQEITTAWNEDLSGEVTIVAGRPYNPSGDLVERGSAIAAEGAVLSQQSYAPGEMGIMFPEPPPTDNVQMREYLTSAMGSPVDNDPVLALDAATLLLNEWTLGNQQQAALLEVLSETPGFEPMGHVTDRVGRPGLAFSAASTSNANFSAVLVIGTAAGSILSIEKIYEGGIAEYSHLKPPAVTSYVAWK